jgi:hypothetical protein
MHPKQIIKLKIFHTTHGQRLAMIDWLEVKDNFKLITGSAGMKAAVVTGKKLKKTDSYKVYIVNNYQYI